MVTTARQKPQTVGVTPVLADGHYWKSSAIEALVNEGIQTLVARDADRRKEPRPGPGDVDSRGRPSGSSSFPTR